MIPVRSKIYTQLNDVKLINLSHTLNPISDLIIIRDTWDKYKWDTMFIKGNAVRNLDETIKGR